MFLKFYHHLRPLSKVEIFFAYKSDENNNLDIFEMVTNTNEHVKEFLNKKITNILDTSNGCKRLQVRLEWWWKHESMF